MKLKYDLIYYIENNKKIYNIDYFETINYLKSLLEEIENEYKELVEKEGCEFENEGRKNK